MSNCRLIPQSQIIFKEPNEVHSNSMFRKTRFLYALFLQADATLMDLRQTFNF